MATASSPGGAIELSIIVPVYNVAPYVEECLLSIYRQSFRGPQEVILVDDCSTDNSAELCQRFIDEHGVDYELIRNSRNQGVSAARNRGLDKMTGRYFMFIDPDDALPPDALATLYEAAQSSRADIVKGNHTTFSRSAEKNARYNVTRTSMIRRDAILTTLYRHEKVRGHVWGKLFRSDTLGSFRFMVGIRMVEDLLYCCEVFTGAESLLLLDKPVYRHRYRESSATKLKFENGSYIEWLDTVETTARFASTPAQHRAHRRLQLRTMTQLTRECRELSPPVARQVLAVIEARLVKWNVRLVSTIREGLGTRAFSHYLKTQLAIGQIKRALGKT